MSQQNLKISTVVKSRKFPKNFQSQIFDFFQGHNFLSNIFLRLTANAREFSTACYLH